MIVAGLLAGCQSLLPRSSSEVSDSWTDFEQARQATARVEPYRAQPAELHTQGLEPGTNPAITLLSFADVSQRFALGTTVTADALDPGLADCFRAGKRCTGHSVVVRRVKRQRVGNFWLDAFKFTRTTDSTGWTFNALILFVDDEVVYTVMGGQPRVSERDITHSPLGPLQSWGDFVAKCSF